MKTLRARDLVKDQTLILENERWKIDRVDVTRRGNIAIWLGDGGHTVKFLNSLDVVVVE